MNYKTTIFQTIRPKLFAVLLGGLSIFVVGTFSGASEPGESGSNGDDHGDNPVVGSLPIEIAEELDFMFANEGRLSGPLLMPTLGIIGNADLGSSILDAGGVPNGQVNRLKGYNIFSLHHDGFMVIPSTEARLGKMELAQWLPNEYIGGEISMSSNIGTFFTPIDVNLTQLPLKNLCSSNAPIVDAMFTILPANDSALSPIRVHVIVVGETVTLTFMP